MEKGLVLRTLLLGSILLALMSCETPSNYNRAAGWEQQRFDCNGDVPSNFPPYCHPRK
jgi:hypothetical protein